MRNLGISVLWFWICYIVVTTVGIMHTIFNIYVRKMGAMDTKGMGEGYEKTKPWHPLYNIVFFSVFGYLYLKGLPAPSLKKAIITGGIWTGICMVVDLVGWVIIKHPWSLSFKEFYIGYQPWISLIYLAIFLGPIIGYYVTLL